MNFAIPLSGVKAIGQQLNAISDNIANTGTDGFKSSRTSFAAIVSGSQVNGVQAGPSSQSMTTAGRLTSTDRAMDGAVDGTGFFVVKGSDGAELYTRHGGFSKASDGFITDMHGRRAQGWSVGGAFGDIKIDSANVPASASTQLRYAANLSNGWSTRPAGEVFDKDDHKTYDYAAYTSVIDSLGRKQQLMQYFRQDPAPGNSVSVHYALNGATVRNAAGQDVVRNLVFDLNGKYAAAPLAALDLGTTAPAGPLSLALDYDGMARSGDGMTTPTVNGTNGYVSGSLIDTAFEKSGNGEIVGRYSNGQTSVLGTVALATFANPEGLLQENNTAWRASTRSGNALYSRPGQGLAGGVVAGNLEGSNADVTHELVSLMSAQRNYQANSKVIQTQNQMMQALLQAL